MSTLPPPTDNPTPDENLLDPNAHKKIPAEILFDKAVYGGISYAAQAGTGILLSHSIRYGRLQKPFNNFVQWITGKAVTKGASTTAILTTMVMVGNAFLIPVKWLENRKPKIVRWINDKMNAGHEPTSEEREAREARLHYLEHHAPKQNWLSLILGRGFGLGVVYGVDHVIGEKNNAFLQERSTELIQKGLGKAGFKGLEKSKMFGEYLRIGFIDSFYSMISAGGLYVYSHILHPHKKPNMEKPENDVSEETESIPLALPLMPISESEKLPAARRVPAKKAYWQSSVNNSGKESTKLPAFP